jgi:hypothetical protein
MGSTGGGYTPPPRPTDTCLSLRFTTKLETAPDAPAYEPGALLNVVPTRLDSNLVFVVIGLEGETVGTIVERVGDMIRCTEQGFTYVAEVKEVFLGAHTVEVYAGDGASS